MTDDTIKITIEYNGKTLGLSPEDARVLYDQLHRMYEVQWLEYKYSITPQPVYEDAESGLRTWASSGTETKATRSACAKRVTMSTRDKNNYQ